MKHSHKLQPLLWKGGNGQWAMNSKIIRIIGLAATVIGLGANLINDWADEQKMNEQIDKKVNEALAKRDADAKES